MEINPYAGEIEKIEGRQFDRFLQTYNFISDNTIELGNVLCIGRLNIFDRKMLSLFKWNLCSHTVGDLDAEWSARDLKYDTVFCFEVIEHLTNPRLFLENLRKRITKETNVFISVPTHLLRRHWRYIHFHEIDKIRMDYLFKITGFKITDYRRVKLYPKLSDITSVRQFLRYITGYSWFISRTDRHFYCVNML